MRVRLIQVTQNPIDVMWTAARTCYSAKSPVEIWDDWGLQVGELKLGVEKLSDAWEQEKEITNKHWNLVKKVLDSGHQSIAEHVYFTFAIEGISRACSHQLVRHRAGIVFSQQSQRYVEIKEDLDELCHLYLELKRDPKDKQDKTVATFEKTEKLLEKYFVDVNPETMEAYLDDLISYKRYINMGYKPEDARKFLPNATKTNITVSVNFRELIHMCNLRLCTRAQKEIRDLHKLMKDEVKEVDERLASYLVPQCEVHNICFEAKCCGRKPTIDEILQNEKIVKELKKQTQNLKDDMYQTIVSREDMEKLFQNEDNPEKQEQLRKLMERSNFEL